METESDIHDTVCSSGDTCNDSELFSYVSCIRVNGRPILPPLMSARRKVEMRDWRQKAVELERRARSMRRDSITSNGISAADAQSTPARPITLNLKTLDREQARHTLEHRLALDLSESDAESERKRWSPLEVSSLQDYRLHGTADSDSTIETPDTVTASPRINRQASFTILKHSQSMSPKLDIGDKMARNSLTHSHTIHTLNTSAELSLNTSGRSNSGRRTWDLQSAKKSWKPSRGHETDTETESCPVTPTKNVTASRSQPRPNSVPSTERVPSETDTNVSVPAAVRDQLSNLSDMMIALMVRHEQQRRELQRQQEQERYKYEHLFTYKQREILEFISFSGDSCESARESATCPGSTAEEKIAPISFRSEPAKRPADNVTKPGQTSMIQNGKQADDKISVLDTDVDITFAEDLHPLKDDDCETWSLSSRASTISIEPAPAAKRNSDMKHVYANLPLCNKAASVICAGIKGYLTRRLMGTETVRALRRSLCDSIQVCKTLKTAPDLGSSDIKLMDGLRRQIFSDWDALYEIFMTKPIPEQMAMISADRERLRGQKRVAPDSGRRVSTATIKSQQRKKNVMSTSLTFPRSTSFRRSCFKMSNSVSGAIPSFK